MTEPDSKSFVDTGLDWSIKDRFTAEEESTLLDWYRNTHGRGDLDLVMFVPFLIENLPAAYKLVRRSTEAAMQARDGVQLPPIAYLLSALHCHVAIAFTNGILYELIAAKQVGATRALVLDVLNYAYLSAGPYGMNATAALSNEYLRDWQDDPAAEPLVWPQGWAPDAAAFRSGIDYSTPDLTDAEVRRISAGNQRHFGAIPRSVELFSRLHPEAYKLHRIRYEQAIGDVMPAQLAPLMTLQLATLRLQPPVMRQAVHQARFLGCRRHHVVQIMYAALRPMAADPMQMGAATDAVGDLLAEWPE
jgi:hypothetical protein